MPTAPASLRRRTMIAPLCLLVSLTAGCEQISDLWSGGGLSTPDATFTGAEVRSISADAAEIGLTLRIDNPYPVPLPLADLSYQLSAYDQQFASGDAFIGGRVPAGGAKEVTVPVSVRFRELLSVLSAVRPGQVVPYTGELALVATGPENRQVRLPLRAHGRLPVPAAPQVQVEALDLRELNLQNVLGTARVLVENRNQFPVTLRQMAYDLSLAGVSVADTTIQPGMDFRPGETHSVEIPLMFRPTSLGRAIFQALRAGQVGYQIEGTTRLTSPYGPLEMNFRDSGDAPVSARE